VVAQVVRESESLAMEKRVELGFQPPNGPAVAFANEAGVRRLLLILIENALRHTPASGRITVATSTSPDSIVLTVQDTGEGIAADSLPHVFERFYSGNSASNGAGTGLGLSIAQAIAEAHGSGIEVESAHGRGARFSIPFRRDSDSGHIACE
jgi:signal transduction histidine kinase